MGAVPNVKRRRLPSKNYLNPPPLPSQNLSLPPFPIPPHSFLFTICLRPPFPLLSCNLLSSFCLATFDLIPQLPNLAVVSSTIPPTLDACAHFRIPHRIANSFSTGTTWQRHALALTVAIVARNSKPKASLTMTLPWTSTLLIKT